MSNYVRKKTFCPFIFVSVIALLTVFPAKASSEYQMNSETEISGKNSLKNFTLHSFSEQDNFFRRLFGISNKSRSQKNSRSPRHSSSRPKRYSPPSSNSQNPDTFKGGSGSNQSTDPTAVKNNPKPALHKSLRDQHQSSGIWELGLTLGTSHAVSDIGGNKGVPIGDFAEYQISNYSLSGGLFGRYIMNDWFAMNLGMNFANLKAEREFVPEGSEILRFNNDIFEFFANTEFRLPALSRSPFDLYGFVGIGIFFSDASIYDQNDRLISTQVDYSQVQPVIPFGGGFSVKLTQNLRLGYELGWRNTIFHYLDGVKKDENYDHYFMNSFKIGFVF